VLALRRSFHAQPLAALAAVAALSLSRLTAASPAGLVAAYEFDESSGKSAIDVSDLANAGTLNDTACSTARARW